MKIWFVPIALLLVAGLSVHAQSSPDGVADRLAEAGFVNIRCVEADDHVVYTVENDSYKLQASGLAAAVRIIEDAGIPQGKYVKVIATKYKIPEVTLTYCPDDAKWHTTYRLDESWKEVKDSPLVNDSFGNVDIVLYPQLSLANLIVTQVYQVLFQINPAVECSLWPGGKITAQLLCPIYCNDGNSGNLGFADYQKVVRPEFLTVSQNFRLPGNVFGRFTAGNFNSSHMGFDLQFMYPFKNERFALSADLALVYNLYFSGFSRISGFSEAKLVGNLTGSYYWAEQNLKLSLGGQQFLFGGFGLKAEAKRYFRHVTIGLYLEKGLWGDKLVRKTVKDGDREFQITVNEPASFSDIKLNGGFRFSVALPPYRSARYRKAPRVTTGNIGMTYNANNERYYYRECKSEASDNIMSDNDFNPLYIDSEILKLNK